jgi:hypothetical protein
VPWIDVLGEQEREIARTRRHRERERAKAGKGFVMSMVVSCGDGIRDRWRTELDHSCRKPFDDEHRPTALGTSPKIARTDGGGLLLGMWCGTEQL